MVAFMAGCVAFQAFAWGTPSSLTLEGFVGFHDVPFVVVLLLGTVADDRRAEAIGSIGEILVRAELRTLGWPTLSNVVLPLGRAAAEIDHLVRAPDGILVIETKTLAGAVDGAPQDQLWSQRTRNGVHSLQNPLVQNAAHLDAVRAVIANLAMSTRGLVVSAGSARFSPPIAECVARSGPRAPGGRGGPAVRAGGDQCRMEPAYRGGGAWRTVARGARRLCALTQTSPPGVAVRLVSPRPLPRSITAPRRRKPPAE